MGSAHCDSAHQPALTLFPEGHTAMQAEAVSKKSFQEDKIYRYCTTASNPVLLSLGKSDLMNPLEEFQPNSLPTN